MHKTARVRIEGRVQGVGFRAWVERRARQMSLAGWVRNRSDGSVEAMFQGPADVVDNMVAACGRGPSSALVTRVAALDPESDPPQSRDFRVLPTL
jgi:acylphosphatase